MFDDPKHKCTHVEIIKKSRGKYKKRTPSQKEEFKKQQSIQNKERRLKKHIQKVKRERNDMIYENKIKLEKLDQINISDAFKINCPSLW